MTDVLMPRLSDTMEEGVLSVWRKHEGDVVHRGDVLAEIDTDKATMELEAYDEGVLARTLIEEGASVPIGTPIAVITPGGPVPDGTSEAPAPAPVAAPQPPPETVPEPPRPAPTRPPAPPPSAGLTASPLARRLAREHGVDLAAVQGSGPGGRIVRADIDAAVARTPPSAPPPSAPEPAAPPAALGADAEEVPLSRIRRLTAQRLTASAAQAPHFYLTRTVDVDALLAFRAQINNGLAEGGARVSLNDLVVKASAHALAAHPEVNSSWAGTRLLRHRRVNIGVAVALEDGLIVPVIHDADRKSITQISGEARDLAHRARTGRLSLEEITGGTFTVSNLGMYGIDQFTAVINPPEAAILAVGAAAAAPTVREGQLAVAAIMTLTLAIDHRVLDGAAGARFLADLVALLEHPLRILL
ncbi:dihydrolipoamide acetyltransferase family protein [Sinomonas terrae]|uniref:Dihydrolipoamide acetyltransferase component of pyruvate dehydrogenase complex n=1 Tax=Sinomonas terrae TaxID=2908838 RepID=A0ABS9U710_9MICC|nr:dihydrolipoamide acetyltransferase family protein [Sinomonas terrae]MCH6472488.1 2-oxo acid dehydrogenase subunit E2 [Sinomonas terrae]